MESLNLIKDEKIDLVYVSKYSERDGTLAQRNLKDDVPKEVKIDRFERLTDAMMEVSHDYNQQFVGKTVQVLVERIRKGYADGKIPEFKMCRFPLRDGVDSADLIGKYVYVKVERAMEWALEGKATGSPQ